MKPIQRGLLLNSEAQFLFIYFESTDTYDWQRQPIVWKKNQTLIFNAMKKRFLKELNSMMLQRVLPRLTLFFHSMSLRTSMYYSKCKIN